MQSQTGLYKVVEADSIWVCPVELVDEELHDAAGEVVPKGTEGLRQLGLVDTTRLIPAIKIKKTCRDFRKRNSQYFFSYIHGWNNEEKNWLFFCCRQYLLVKSFEAILPVYNVSPEWTEIIKVDFSILFLIKHSCKRQKLILTIQMKWH